MISGREGPSTMGGMGGGVEALSYDQIVNKREGGKPEGNRGSGQ